MALVSYSLGMKIKFRDLWYIHLEITKMYKGKLGAIFMKVQNNFMILTSMSMEFLKNYLMDDLRLA